MLRRHFGGGVALTETNVASSIAAGGSLWFRRTDHLGLELDWTNGATLARGRQHHVADEVVDNASWGAGWLTDLAVRVDIRVARRASLLMSYLVGARDDCSIFGPTPPNAAA